MNNNKLIIAAAGSGKTTYLVNEALNVSSESVFITTYTEANEAEIRKKITAKKGYIPSNITIQTWFTFMLQHGVRPFQSVLKDDIHEKDIGFYLTNQKSGHRYEKVYWGEKDFEKFYFTKSMKIYSDKISKFVFECNNKSNGLVFDCIFRVNPATHSKGKRPLIPIESGHPFQSIPATDSKGRRPGYGGKELRAKKLPEEEKRALVNF